VRSGDEPCMRLSRRCRTSMACTCLPGPSVLPARQLREASRLSSSAARSCAQGRRAQPRAHGRVGCLVCGSMTQDV